MTTRSLLDAEQLPADTPVRVEVGTHALCVVRCGDEVHVVDDLCTHGAASLSEGEVDADDCTIECPLHGSAFQLSDGTPLTFPATRPVSVYPARIVDGAVVAELPDGLGGVAAGEA